MKILLLTLVLMAACIDWSSAQAHSFEDCCLTYTRVKNPRRVQRNMLRYQVQHTGGGCNLHAVILELPCATICVNPADKWVKNLIGSSKKGQFKKNETRRKWKRDPKRCKKQQRK
ncbi:C-C motif chemokine 21b-like [Amblyraja radiata]|uniref:C-C motif chemokine 21b-like n=1 Tax=Amblyraja radiata TaxID=386614 RepID=UPI0014037791|nr:C-C motif chemokine 21b-like [Amblyraja radiata]